MSERAFHDSRDQTYRSPYGAVVPGAAVALRVDVWDAPDAAVTLRTWVDGVGESRYAMRRLEEPGVHGSCRYGATLVPASVGVTWYYFIVEEAGGRTWRYGARDGCYGGIGRVCEWEPPSFALAVCREQDEPRIVEGIFAGADAMRRAPMELMVRFLRGELPAPQVVEAWETLRETCLPETLRLSFDLLGTFGQRQLFALLAGAGDLATPPEELPDVHGDAAAEGLAKARLWCASLVQMLATADPVVYDCGGGPDRAVARGEAATVGIAPVAPDAALPCAPCPDDRDCEDIVRNALELHDALPVFGDGLLRFFAVNDDILGLWRCAAGGTSACVLVNASTREAFDVDVPFIAEAVSDVLGGYAVPEVPAGEAHAPRVGTLETPRYARAHLHQLGSAVLFFHPRERLQRPMAPGVGVLAHVTSLPAEPQGPEAQPARGTLGASARAFVDWLAQAGAAYWQILPVNPTDEHGSPYAGISAFAGNLDLLELNAGEGPSDRGRSLVQEHPAAYRAFRERAGEWIEPYACFMAIREREGAGVRWQEWPRGFRRFDPAAVAADDGLAAAAERWRLGQFAFDWQWRELRRYAAGRGVRIIGDMPIYVSADSADVWANRGIFQLGPDGRPQVVAGCPPDSFAADGQVWGNPVYDWDACKRDGYAWWLARLRRAFDLYDVVRMDHFIGFMRYFCIPAGGRAADGAYRDGPGFGFFRAARRAFGPLPIIAEDLGAITPGVRALGTACGFPGMDVVQFADGGDPLAGYRPRPEKVVYTGTHDNRTLVGYAQARYPRLDASDVARRLEDAAATCGSDVCVFPLQDVLGLDDGARMNTPGTTRGNWGWQADAADVSRQADRLRELVALHAGCRAQAGRGEQG